LASNAAKDFNHLIFIAVVQVNWRSDPASVKLIGDIFFETDQVGFVHFRVSDRWRR
jgi:hypothetical protein